MNNFKVFEKKVCFCIPARFASTRLPHKLLLKLNNESCIRRTIKQVLKSKYYNNNLYVLTDNELIKTELNDLNCYVLMTGEDYKNGSERISRNLSKINEKYDIIVNVQADEPYVSERNIDFCIEKHLKTTDNIFYTTLHEIKNNKEYLKSTASLKVITDNNDNVIYYSRNIIPWNKNGELIDNYIYKTFTGIYVFNRNMLKIYSQLKDTSLQKMEDCEQLKILENGYKIKSYNTVEYNEISLNTKEDYDYLLKKYCL